ncbi:2,3-diketo-L-gulonate TRAP transporter small permease protein yiaM [Anaerobiospirillum thomasii]|uniref:TRAP transporter small permease protein n=1 Tax=Anaerobiospirillum thomasii TaxID=179995 RepID=A0A2X0VE28_9GAMM|nr:TRAP transporter small permease [Anaerobiospirillum thomasii]SPT68929.1 2,3-diketo-L-gulonate TRAP transporter small permease protein yiaM [Anaerobiospirillum thomasii]SPT71165.1 2,3-diketo-L-gulonate TRAP transporter small permease protein yiaM [Anaerobiospirillum thomasii]
MKLIDIVKKLVTWACSFALALMATIVFIQVINRNIFGGSFKWVEEMASMCMVWITFFGAALATTLNAHTRIELFVSLLPKRLSRTIFALGDLVCAAFSTALCCYSYPLIMANLHTMSPAMKLPLAINYIVFFIAALLITFFMILRAVEDFKDKEQKKEN